MKEKRKIVLILGSHAHVPSGAPESEFEYVYENRMRPFVSNLYRYSNIHAVLHYSGVLLYWVERTHPEFFMLIEDMVSRKQIEILGGGFYEPMFPLIPLQDKIGQVELMTTYLRKHFGKRPLGCWIPCMVWEQPLANTLSASDIIYTFLSQEQFKLAGVNDDELFTPCISEDQGKIITIFPVSLTVENDLANKSFSQVFIEFNKTINGESELSSAENSPNDILSGRKLICVFPEKVSSSAGEAPDTAWNRFFEEISLSDNIVETILPAKIIKSHKTQLKLSFPNSSSIINPLGLNSINDFSPRRFIIKHNEANGIYSKMIFTNVLINQLKGDKYRKLNAREELWKAQDSCLFSPGNGYLRNELRKAAYSSLLRAESLSREKGKVAFSLIQYDFDFDGIKEYLFQDSRINCYIQQKGAGIFELDYLPQEWNYLDCGSDNFGRRTSFADIIAPANTKPEALSNLRFADVLSNSCRLCFNEYYETVAQDKKGKSCFKLPASIEVTSIEAASAESESVPFGNIEINKCFMLKKDIITVSYTLKNTGNNQQKCQFIPEINFSFAGITDEFVRFYSVESAGKDISADKFLNSSNIKILDIKNEVQIILASVKVFSAYIIPAFNNGMYQATCILPVFSVSLKAGESWTNEFTLKFSH